MSEQATITQDERTMAGLAHGGVLIGALTGGFGGIIVALIIWLSQREKSAYVASQALQAAVYQTAASIITWISLCCWGAMWLLLFMSPLMADPEAYENTPPSGFWVGLFLITVPIGIWALTFLYGIWGALRNLSGHDFKYPILGDWVTRQRK